MYNWTSFLVCFRSTDGSRKINRSISLRATVSECCNWLHAPEDGRLTSRIGTLRQSSRNINRNVRAGYRNNILQLTSRSEYCRLTSRIGTLRQSSRNINRNVRAGYRNNILQLTSRSEYCRLTSRIGTLRQSSRNINRNVRLRATVTIFSNWLHDQNTATVFTEYLPQCPFAGYRNNIPYNFVVVTADWQ